MEVLTLLMLLKQTYCREIIYPNNLYRNELHETHSKTPFSWLIITDVIGTRAPLTTVSVSNINNAIAISSGNNHTCALLSDRSIKCWGNGNVGQLGNGSSANQNTPVLVSGFGG